MTNELPIDPRDLLAASDLFDSASYLDQNPDVAVAKIDPVEHYLAFGWREGRRPGPHFDGEWYLRENPDVAQSGVNPLVHYLVAGRSEGRRRCKGVVVYTAIIGNYDELRALSSSILTSITSPLSTTGSRLPAPWIRRSYTREHGSDRLTARFIKTHPHLLLPEYEVSVWIDAAFQIRALTSHAALAALDRAPIAFFLHPDRDCVYEEADAILGHGLDASESVEAMVALLRAEEYPEHADLVATGVMIRPLGDSRVVRAMEQWWTLISKHAARDQLSINFVLRQHAVPSATLPGSLWRNELVEWVGHGPKPWRGLQCGGAYLDAEEYEAIERMVVDLQIGSVVETGAGETARLFKMLGVQALSIESHPGPWSRRAQSSGCAVAEVPFQPQERVFSRVALRSALAGFPRVDLVFIDSPVGTENRQHVLTQILDLVRTRYVLYHDVRRDLSNIFDDQQRHRLRLARFVNSSRGLALFAVNGGSS